MTNPVNSFHTNFGRFYNHPKFALERMKAKTALGSLGAEIVIDPSDPFGPKPSITNIIGVIDKPFLPPYYARLVAEYAIENLDALRDQIGKFGPQVAIGALKAIPNRPHPNGPIGDEIHDAIDLYAQGRANEVEGFSTTTAAAMWAQFRYFMTQYPAKLLRSEYTVWSYKHGYAGTGDLLWETSEGLWVVDTKSGTNVHPEVGLQTAAIAGADVILSADGREFPMPKANVLGVMHVRPRSVKLHRLERRESNFEAFLAAKRIFDWMRFDRDSVIQEVPFRTEKPKEFK